VAAADLRRASVGNRGRKGLGRPVELWRRVVRRHQKHWLADRGEGGGVCLKQPSALRKLRAESRGCATTGDPASRGRAPERLASSLRRLWAAPRPSQSPGSSCPALPLRPGKAGALPAWLRTTAARPGQKLGASGLRRPLLAQCSHARNSRKRGGLTRITGHRGQRWLATARRSWRALTGEALSLKPFLARKRAVSRAPNIFRTSAPRFSALRHGFRAVPLDGREASERSLEFRAWLG
jgi:hypothetical protein